MGLRSRETDPLTGITTEFHTDAVEDIVRIKTSQNVEPILELNKERAKVDHDRQGIKKSWMHAASIPNVVIHQWLTEDGIDFYNPDHYPAVKRKLNSPEWRYLRTGSAKL